MVLQLERASSPLEGLLGYTAALAPPPEFLTPKSIGGGPENLHACLTRSWVMLLLLIRGSHLEHATLLGPRQASLELLPPLRRREGAPGWPRSDAQKSDTPSSTAENGCSAPPPRVLAPHPKSWSAQSLGSIQLPLQPLPKTVEKKEEDLKSLLCTMEKNIKELSCSLKPYICKYTHLNNCQFICLIKLGIQILACVCTVVSLRGSDLSSHMKDELLASLLGPCLFRTERNN